MLYRELSAKSFRGTVSILLCFICLASTLIAQEHPATASKTEPGVESKKDLTPEEEALVRGSREAILRSGLSAGYFDSHFKLMKVSNAPADRRVIWKFSVNEHETIVQDSVGVAYVGNERKQSHAVSSTLPLMSEIHRTVSRRRAEQLLRACIGSFSDASVEFRPIDETGKVGLFLAAAAKPKVHESAAEPPTKARAKASEPGSRASTVNATVVAGHNTGQPVSQADSLKPKSGKRPPLIVLGAINLQTGKCTKGVGQVGPPRVN